MNQLIAIIIAVVVGAVATIAGVFYGGDAMTSGSTKANAQTVMAQLQQIAAATQMYESENGGAAPADVAALVTAKYLSSAPTIPAAAGTGSYELQSGIMSVSGISGVRLLLVGPGDYSALCGKINAMQGRADSVADWSVAADGSLPKMIQSTSTPQSGCGIYEADGTKMAYFSIRKG